MKERIQKILANAGVASRRQVEQMVLDGRVSVNGQVVTELPVLIDPEKDRIEVDGERVKLGTARTEKRYYFLLNKPKGVYSTNVAQGAQVRAIDLLPQGLKARVYPVGQLDADSRGLMLLTNDGELTNQLTHPRYGVAKTYRAVVEGSIEPATVDELQQGVWMADKEGKGLKTGKSYIKIVRRARLESILELTIREGRNHQVRRMLAKLGHKVKDLTRIRMGPLNLEGLPAGRFRELTPREVKELQKLGESKEKRHEEEAKSGSGHGPRPEGKGIGKAAIRREPRPSRAPKAATPEPKPLKFGKPPQRRRPPRPSRPA